MISNYTIGNSTTGNTRFSITKARSIFSVAQSACAMLKDRTSLTMIAIAQSATIIGKSLQLNRIIHSIVAGIVSESRLSYRYKTMIAIAKTINVFSRNRRRELVAIAQSIVIQTKSMELARTFESISSGITAMRKATWQSLVVVAESIAITSKLPRKTFLVISETLTTIGRSHERVIVVISESILGFQKGLKRTIGAISSGVVSISKIFTKVVGIAVISAGLVGLTKLSSFFRLLGSIARGVATTMIPDKYKYKNKYIIQEDENNYKTKYNQYEF